MPNQIFCFSQNPHLTLLGLKDDGIAGYYRFP